MSASFPSSVKTFTSRNSGDVLQPAHVNDLQDEVSAVETTLLAIVVGQVAFPAVQNASATANTLDDYEEGTWVPTLGGSGGTSGQTYGNRIGWYVKVGQLVTLGFDFTMTVEGTITGNCEIQGLPFANNLTYASVCSVQWDTTQTNFVSISGYLGPNSSVIQLFGTAAAAASNMATALTAANVQNNTLLRGVIQYRAPS